MNQSRMYQTVVLVLTDGREISAHVPAFCTSEDVRDGRIKVSRVRIVEARELPQGCSFVTLDSDEKAQDAQSVESDAKNAPQPDSEPATVTSEDSQKRKRGRRWATK